MQHGGDLETAGTPTLPPPPSWVELTQSKSPRRFLSLGLCLPISGLLLVGLFLSAPWQRQQRLGQEAHLQPNTIVRLILEDFTSVDPPVLVPRADPESQFPNEPVGGGNSLGTGTIDPELRALPSLAVIANIPELIAPPAAPNPLSTQSQALAIDKSLPVVPGGNGIPKGEGHGYGTGQGNGIGSGKGLGNPEEITILHQTIPNYQLQPGDDFELLSKPVGVRLLVNAEGIPTEARPVSGPPRLYDVFTRSALEWRFHVPLSVRKNAPFRFTINFWPKLTKSQKVR